MAENPNKINPWGLRPLSGTVEDELKRRAAEYGMNPIDITSVEKKSYSGPRTAWMRVCSNGMNFDPVSGRVKKGFVLGGVHGFNDTYGFEKADSGNKDKVTILGYTADGKTPHELANNEGSTFPHRPAPGIIGIETEFYGAGSSYPGLCRKITIRWRCNSTDQIEYMFPYFLSPGVSVVAEWGWNNYNPSSLVDLENIGHAASDTSPGAGIIGMFTNSELIYANIEKSKGNYDCQVGKIFDYSIKMNSAGGYECTTIVVNSMFLIEGQSLSQSSTKNDEEKTALKSFKETVKNGLVNFAEEGPHFKRRENGTKNKSKIWIPFGRFADFLNKYLSLTQPAQGEGAATHKTQILDISKQVISAHQLLKSVNSDILIPNPYAPNLTPSTKAVSDIRQKINLARIQKDKVEKDFGEKNLSNLSEKVLSSETKEAAALSPQVDKLFGIKKRSGIAGTSYQNAEFGEFEKKFEDLGLEFEYDDLNKVINAGRWATEDTAFPRFKDIVTDDGASHKSGLYGYLKDIYISTELIAEAVDSNDTTLKLLEHILGLISQAGSKIWDFRVSPSENASYGVIDNNYVPKVAKVPIFTLGTLGSAHFTDLDLNIKMTQELANQAILGQNKYVYRNGSSAPGTLKNPNPVLTNNDTKVSMFTSDDRLFGYAWSGDATIEPKEVSLINKFQKVMSRYNDKDAIISTDANGTKHILTEHDETLMSQLVNLGSDASYLASPLMPGTEINLTCMGIGGIRFLDMFALDKIPNPYSYKRAVWQIEGVRNVIEGNKWETSIMARVRPITII